MRILTAVLIAVAIPAAGQEPASRPAATTRRIAAGPRYKAGPIHRWLLGPTYRDLWTTPIDVEVLDLATFAGGLTATKKGGGMQTKTLRFEAPDGRRFRVRSVDKDPTPTLPPDLRDTFAEWVVQDQISTAHPAGPIIVDGLADAAGIRHVEHRFVVLPDDPRLGEFRKEFAGLLGIMEEEVRLEPPVTPGFADVVKTVEGDEMNKLADAGAGDRVDDRALLKARLFDIFIGDWDRHIGQWDWARVKGSDKWQPIPADRDQAFSKFDGLILALARASQPRFVNFERKYPYIVGIGWNGRLVDRRYLAALDRPAFRDVALELQKSLTDAAIEKAARRMPAPYYRLNGARTVERLKSRRDRLPQVADLFYEMLAREAEVHATDEGDVAEITRAGDTVEVRVSAAGKDTPYFQRTFREDDTSEIRLYLKKGNDRATSRGQGDPIKVRVVGGPGADIFDDSAVGHSRFYDHEGENRLVPGPGTEESNKPYTFPLDRGGYPLRDWGKATIPAVVVTGGGDMGVFLGLNVDFYSYGFRKHPYASRQSVRAGYSTALTGFKAEYDGEFAHTNSRKQRRLFARVSDVEIVRFHGFGNETPAEQESDFFKTPQRQFVLNPSFRFGLDAPVDLSVGVIGKFTQPDLIPGRFLTITRPYGSDDFGQVGAQAALVVDKRNRPKAASKGVILSAAGTFYPKAWDVEENFGEAHGEMAGFLTFGPTLALRVGGKQLWGRYPYHEAAFIGGPDTVRGLRRQRYAGDASVFGNAELRQRLFDFKLLVPIDVGVFGLADGGRVFVDGEESDTWHHGVGGGVSFTFLRPEYTFSIAGARGSDDDKIRLYFQGGFGF
jgi:hypothetical protein